MSSNFKCTFCGRYYSTLRGLTKHLNQCVQAVSSTESEVTSDINDRSLDSNEFSNVVELQSIQEDLPNIMEEDYIPESDEEYAADTSLISQLNFPNKQYEEVSFNPDEITSEEMIPRDTMSPEEHDKTDEKSEDFPNEVYADFMNLITKYNVNNKTADAFIKFFNKYSNLSQSPLPKNIKAGRKYMDKMDILHLSHEKHSLFVDNEEYFIYYRPILECIKNLLFNPEIVQHFVYYYQDLRVI
jgi:hypothetical protein